MKTDLNPPRPWWQEPYLWLVLGLPLSAVLACVVTAIYIFQGPEAVLVQDLRVQDKAQALAREIGQASAPSQPALMGRNHSATGGAQHARP
jgi:hypothetical protein